jgi:hypothetical protein
MRRRLPARGEPCGVRCVGGRGPIHRHPVLTGRDDETVREAFQGSATSCVRPGRLAARSNAASGRLSR